MQGDDEKRAVVCHVGPEEDEGGGAGSRAAEAAFWFVLPFSLSLFHTGD